MSETESESSERYDEPVYTPYTIPTTNPTLNDFRKALDHAHEHTQDLLEHTKKLRAELSEARAQIRFLKNKGGKSRKKKRADNLLNYDKITLLGKKYAVFIGPWCSPAYFMVPTPEDSPHPQSIARFESFETYKVGGIKELHEYLGGEKQLLEQAKEYVPFREAFIKEVNASRSTSIHNVQASAPIVFASLSLPANLWARNAGAQRKESPEFQKLFLFPGEQRPKTLIPLYYPNLKKDSKQLFMVDALTNVLRLMLWGKQSLTATRFNYENRLVGSKWGADHVNNSMIAFAVIVAKYLISEDTEFMEEGAVSRIPYYLQFYKILRLLKNAEHTQYYKELLAFWNHRVFKDRAMSATGLSTAANESDGDDSDLNDMAEALQRVTLSQPTSGPSVHSAAPAAPSDAIQYIDSLDDSDLSDAPGPTDTSPADKSQHIDPGAIDPEVDPLPAAGHEPRITRRGRGRGKSAHTTDHEVVTQDAVQRTTDTRPKPKPRKRK
ncbi:hypothetical protein C8R42DRAFT_721896 [Lentinula raphanica]|nr:hypothetical protein C8R42DRAFT_721896 [Lentinula raphanica]